MPIGRAWILDNRQIFPPCEANHVALLDHEHGAKDLQVRAVKMRHGRKAVVVPLQHQVHQARFDEVILMVRIRDFIASQRHCLVVERAAPELGAQTARVLLLADFKHNLVHLCIHKIERHV